MRGGLATVSSLRPIGVRPFVTMRIPSPDPMIETARLLLRDWRASDREPFHRINSDPRVMEYFPAPLSREESDSLIARIEAHQAQHGFTFFAAELRHTAQFIGFIGMVHTPFEAHFTPCVEIGWRLAAEFWGQGLATEGAHAVLRFGFDELKLPEIVALTVPANLRSRRVMEKLGMTCNPADDFDHPRLPPGHPLRPHVLYRARASRRAR
jgi:RimJ/RimL family protein N-acetyltransferase